VPSIRATILNVAANAHDRAMNILHLPDLGASTGEAELVVWLKAVGEHVAAGEPLLEVQSDKANVEVEATASGTLARVLAQPGQILKPGEPLAVIAEPGEPQDAAAIDRALARPGG
jgi:pyruvate/2-oxoglutarate dehydrogenase complex dihydrolipoamide acyltransferase (E2) component